jgi:hypothetical protein
VTAPTWPQLAGWLATAGRPSLSGQIAARRHLADPETTVLVARHEQDLRLDFPDGTVVLRAEQGATAIGPDGALEPGHANVPEEIDWLLRVRGWQRGDFHRALGPVRQVEAAGRLAWEVALEAPQHKIGPLVLVVDDETGILLAQRNEDAASGFSARFTELALTGPLGPRFVHRGIKAADGPKRHAERRRALDDLQASLPKVRRWPPGFLPRVQDERVDVLVTEIQFWPAMVQLARGPLDAQLPDLPLRWQHKGHAYGMGVDGREFPDDELRRMQDSVVDRRVE